MRNPILYAALSLLLSVGPVIAQSANPTNGTKDILENHGFRECKSRLNAIPTENNLRANIDLLLDCGRLIFESRDEQLKTRLDGILSFTLGAREGALEEAKQRAKESSQTRDCDLQVISAEGKIVDLGKTLANNPMPPSSNKSSGEQIDDLLQLLNECAGPIIESSRNADARRALATVSFAMMNSLKEETNDSSKLLKEVLDLNDRQNTDLKELLTAYVELYNEVAAYGVVSESEKSRLKQELEKAENNSRTIKVVVQQPSSQGKPPSSGSIHCESHSIGQYTYTDCK
jgi:hypothetical protein